MESPISSSSSSSSVSSHRAQGVLPRKGELPLHHLEFLNQNLSTREDLLTKAPLLLSDLEKLCNDYDVNLFDLHRQLSKLVVSWISCSFAAKSSVRNLSVSLENLCLVSSQCGIGSKKHQTVVMEELPQLAKRVLLIQTIREYADTALRLEPLIGDLEDVVFSSGTNSVRNMISTKLLTSQVSMDFGSKQEMLGRAIKLMNDIEKVLVDIVQSHPQWNSLLDSVDARVEKTLAIVRPQIFADHRALLASLGWPPKLSLSKTDGREIVSLPNPLLLMGGDKRELYSKSFLTVCALQHMQTRRESRQHKSNEPKDHTIGLWAIDELVSPIASRMEYHFSKWDEQPELMFALVYKTTSDFIVGVDDVLQPLIDRARLVSYSAKEAWVSATVQLLSGFLVRSVFPVLVEKYKKKETKSDAISSWLHLIDCMVAFDKQMRSLVNSDSCFFLEDSERFEGLSRSLSVLEVFCEMPDWLKLWARIEVKDAWNKLKPEMGDERFWSVDIKDRDDSGVGTESDHFLLSTSQEHKAPPIAECSLKIIWQLIEKSRSLPAVLPRVQFLRSTASRFIWYFLNVLVFRCKNTEYPTDYIGDALIRVCGSVNAARYLEFKLKEWSDDIEFLEMRIAERGTECGGTENACFFYEEIKSLGDMQTNWLLEMASVLLHHFETLSWNYTQNKRRFEQRQEEGIKDGGGREMGLVVSVELVEGLDALRNQLEVVSKSLNAKDFFDLWRSSADGLDHYMYRSIFSSSFQFSGEGINQFETDMKALFHVFKPFCVRPEAFFPCIVETIKLLTLDKEEANQLRLVLTRGESRARWLQQFSSIRQLSDDQAVKVLRMRKWLDTCC
ncbi:RINT1-like protein MAG2L [Linum grandiflorum]